MAQAPQRTIVRGPAFIRVLARLIDVEIPPSSQSLSDRLSQWLDWNHAIALSTALDGKPPVAAFDVPTLDGADGEYARVRSSLVKTITDDPAWTGMTQRAADKALVGEVGADEAVDYTAFRQRYLARQRAMQSATGHLRGRLRAMLAQQSADMARLAEVDAAMELALSPREQQLLATVPSLLENHFERLRQAGQAMLAEAQVSEHSPAAMRGAWLGVFRKDMQSVLLAELDVRFQPVDGLLAALRTR